MFITVKMSKINILESCYIKRFSSVGLAGPFAGSIIKRMSSRETVNPVVLLENIAKKPKKSATPHKLHVFMVAVTYSSLLPKTLEHFRNLKWWNHMASFFLIYWPQTGHGCSKAYQMLRQAWKMDLLNSKFMCLHPTRGILIYTFNPYTSEAPVPWQQEGTYPGMKGHVWTLFAREYREDDPRCDALDFDKTLDLGGYEICAAMLNKEYFDAGPHVKGYPGEKVRYPGARMLINSINATWKIMLRPKSYRGNETITIADLTDEVKSGNCDLYFNLLLQGGHDKKSDVIYPAIELSIAMLTRYRGNKSQLDKIISVLDETSRLGVIVVLLITLLFLTFYPRKPIILAFMDLVLLTCNAALSKIPRKLAPRIYFGCLLIFVVTIQGIYQSQLATLLTSDVRLETINSIEDLAHSDHTIYGQREVKIFLYDSAFEGRFVSTSDWKTDVKNFQSNSKSTLVGVDTDLIPLASKRNFHLSDRTIGSIHGVYLIRPNWPLKRRVNAILRTAATSGILNFLQAMEKLSLKNKLKYYEYEYQHQKIKVMTVKTLRFAFVILAIGLGCATITLIIEVIFGKLIGKHRKCIQR